MLGGQELRNFALALLDDEHGINREAWHSLEDMLYDEDQQDIIELVQAQDNRWFLSDHNADLIRSSKIN